MKDLVQKLERLGAPKILVLGDLMLDRYIWGKVERISPEAPIPVLCANEHEARLGGAASVAGLLRTLEANVTIAGVTGSDASSSVLRRLFDEQDVDHSFVICDRERPTTSKERFLGRAAGRHSHQILRVDQESTLPLDRVDEKRLANGLASRIGEFDVLLVSDYAKGVCTPRLLERVIAAARRNNVPVIVDPAQTNDYCNYRGARLVTPNRTEAEMVVKRELVTPDEAIEAGEEIGRRNGIESVLVTLDRDGAVLVEAGEPGCVFPTRQRPVCDVTGAGDTVLALAGLCQAAQLGLTDTAHLANAAAGLQVERLGVCPVSREEIAAELMRDTGGREEKLVDCDKLLSLVNEYRRQGRSIVFTNGCFDLLHVGHVSYLQEAARMGDLLIVAVNSDVSVNRQKGAGRPVIQQSDRAAMLSALNCVNHVIVFDDDTPHVLLRRIRPDVLVKGGNYLEDQVVGREVVESYGGRVCIARSLEGVSTTAILDSVRHGRVACPM